MLTAGDAQDHIRHALGVDMSSEISHMDVVNQAGRWLLSAHPWEWLKRRPVPLDLEAGLGYVRLPTDLGNLISIRGTTSAANGVRLIGLDGVHEAKIDGTAAYPWYGAVARRVMPARNLLAYSEALAQTAVWSYSSGTGAATANAAVNPYTGLNTTTSVSDTDVTAVAALTQTIKPHLLRDNTAYTPWAVIRPHPPETTTPPKTGLLVATPSPASDGRQTLLEIQWGQTPWQDAPTVTVIGTNSGGGVVLDAVPVGEGYWLFAISGYTHQHDANYGRLLVSIQPSRAFWASASGAEDITAVGTVDVARTGCNEGMLPLEYEATTSEVTVPRRAEPVLEVAPVPTQTSKGALSALYRAFWADAEDDGDELTLPAEGWLDTPYIQTVRAYAKGWEESGEGSLDVRLAEVVRGPLFQAAIRHDGRMQRTRGQPRNTAMQMARYAMPSTRFPVDFSNMSPS